jgi:AAA15 family ATPase/GTPase
MIDSWGVGNFKSARKVAPLPFAPLTIFAGPNNSGKSTLIQSILVIAQTIQSRFSQRQLVLNGHIARLGKFQDIASHENGQSPIAIDFKLSPLLDEGNRRRSRFRLHGSEILESVECHFVEVQRLMEFLAV